MWAALWRQAVCPGKHQGMLMRAASVRSVSRPQPHGLLPLPNNHGIAVGSAPPAIAMTEESAP